MKLILLAVLGCFPFIAPAANSSGNRVDTNPSLYMKVQLNGPLNLKGLKPGDPIDGTLSQPVYVGAREIAPAGSLVRLTVDHLEKRRRPRNDHWPWVVQAFTPRRENYPVFRSASVTLSDGRQLPLQVSFLSIANEVDVRARARKSGKGATSAVPPKLTRTGSSLPIATLEAAVPADDTIFESRVADAPNTPSINHDAVTIEAGAQAKVILLGAISASKSRAGDPIEARLIEPLRVGDAVVLPEGTIFKGNILKANHPKWLSRPGSLLFTFDNLVLQQGRTDIVASVSGAELDRRSHTKIDSEGEMRGGWPGKAWMLINLGVTAGIAKEADDTLQLIIEAVVSTATDASTAGVGRIAAACASGIFVITRHGRDVVLPQFTELRITLNRPLTVPASPATPASATPNP